MENAYKRLVGKLKRRAHLAWIYLAHDGVHYWFACELGNEQFGSIKDGEFYDELSDY